MSLTWGLSLLAELCIMLPVSTFYNKLNPCMSCRWSKSLNLIDNQTFPSTAV